MNWFKSDGKRIKDLEGTVRQLEREIAVLRNACTMRVGERRFDYLWSVPPDSRPVLTAIQVVQKLMADAGIEAKEVKGVGAHVEFVQEKKKKKGAK